MMGKWCLHASSFSFDRIIIKVAGNQDRHKSSDESDFGPLVSMAHLYVFFEMRFDLGTLDSGERSLPFALLVCCSQQLKSIANQRIYANKAAHCFQMVTSAISEYWFKRFYKKGTEHIHYMLIQM